MPQDDTEHHHDGVTRRTALRLGAATGAAVLAAPALKHLHGRDVFDLGDALPALTPVPNWPVPGIITRSQWGANEALRRTGRSYDSSIAKIVVHHTGTPNDVTNYAGLCRSILANETAGEYIDIAYNWLIDPNGNIYEGRWATDYSGGAPHTGELNGANVRGAHAIYHNTRTIGVALMGNYDTAAPSSAMIDGLVRFLAWKCARWGVDPRGRGTYNASNGAVENLLNICGHRDTSATACPGGHVEALLPQIRDRVAARVLGGGYWIAGLNGRTIGFGGVSSGNDNFGQRVAAIAGRPAGTGYWLCSPEGAIFTFGDAQYYGGMYGKRLNAPIVGLAARPQGDGYWMVAADGGIFGFGGARFHGSTGGMRLNAPVLGMAPTKSGNGYWLYARDGGIFGYGDARFYGSTGGIRLNQPVVGMTARPQGDGYWMVAADGGIFGFGGAKFYGSGVGRGTGSTCVGMLTTTTGHGYVLLRRDATVDNFGDAPFLGNAHNLLGGTAIGIAGHLKPL